MRIKIFISSLSGGGAERVVCNLSNYLSQKHNVTIITMANGEPDYKLDNSIERISLDNGNSENYILKNLKRVIKLRKILKRSDEDIYIVFLKTPSFILLTFRKLIKVPIIVSERADPSTYFNESKIKTYIMEKLYPKADGFVFQTEDAMNYYLDIIGDKGIVIPNAINEDFLREPYKGLRKKKIVSAGRFTDQKNFTLLIEAFAKVSQIHSDYELVIYGDGPQRDKLQSLTKKLGISEKVKFPGYVKNFGDHIIDASLFVLSSNFEGMPNALMEAMALGLPCISTDCSVGGPRFLINDGVNGFLTPVGDAEKLTVTMDRVLSNQILATEIGANARKISDELSYENVYNKWENYLKEVSHLK